MPPNKPENSQSRDALILTREYFDRRDGLQLVVWARSTDGPIRVTITGQEAVMFVDRQLPHKEGRRRERPLESLSGRPVDAVYFQSQRALRRERDRMRDQQLRTFEGDLRPHDRFLMERFVTGGIRIEGEAQPKQGYIEFVNPKISACDCRPELRTISFDIETDGFEGALLSIACAGQDTPERPRSE